MGTSTNAYLMYGYDLGSEHAGWKVHQTNNDGELTVSWLSEYENFEEAAMRVLLAGVGFTETDWRADGYFDRKRAAEATLGVEFGTHCSGDYPHYVLTPKVITAWRGDSVPVDFAALNAEADAKDWNGKLADAMAALGLRSTTQDRPSWLLASYWS